MAKIKRHFTEGYKLKIVEQLRYATKQERIEILNREMLTYTLVSSWITIYGRKEKGTHAITRSVTDSQKERILSEGESFRTHNELLNFLKLENISYSRYMAWRREAKRNAPYREAVKLQIQPFGGTKSQATQPTVNPNSDAAFAERVKTLLQRIAYNDAMIKNLEKILNSIG